LVGRSTLHRRFDQTHRSGQLGKRPHRGKLARVAGSQMKPPGRNWIKHIFGVTTQ